MGRGHDTPTHVSLTMPVTKQYLRYVAAGSFGVVCSRKAGALLLRERNGKGRRKRGVFVAAPALEHVILWDLRTGEKVQCGWVWAWWSRDLCV